MEHAAIVCPDFQRAAQGMAPLVRSLLVEHADPAKVPVDSLLIALGRRGDHAAIRAARKEFDVLHVPAALSSASCASLRSAVDCERRLLADSVDQCPEHQRNLNSEELEKLLGAEAFGRLISLPHVYEKRRDGAAPSSVEMDEIEDAEARATGILTLREAFIRRYSSDTRPWNPFHQDAYRTTVNVALSADEVHVGGRLLGCYAGKVQVIERAEGEATVHSSELLHAVSRMTSGVRYSLILFFDPRPRVVRKDGLVEARWANRRWVPPSGNERWWE